MADDQSDQEAAARRDYWEDKARAEGDDPNFTLPDYNLRDLEAEYVIRHLRKTDRTVDVGCGNGATTVRYAEHVEHVIGADFSAPSIERARELHAAPNVDYRVADVTDLDLPDAEFDVVITERCLINLIDWETQQKAIGEVVRILKPGGRFLMCESFEEPFVRFAELRRSFDLEPMSRHWHNRLLREEEIRPFLERFFDVLAVERMGLYYLISRLVHPLLVSPQAPTYEADVNRIAVRVTMGMSPDYLSDISVNGLYVLQKKQD